MNDAAIWGGRCDAVSARIRTRPVISGQYANDEIPPAPAFPTISSKVRIPVKPIIYFGGKPIT